ncbi:MAG TPA: HEPN domain-containing protein, partial [Thermoplasmata archaeon]|nr:HEPN domain-containing protein [Thermoplasmata archaeon]
KISINPKNNYLNYLKKAQEFFQTMQTACESENWNSVGLEAVHCVISVNDALLVFFGGIKSVSSNHMDAVRLLTEIIDTDEARKNSNHLRRVIAKKNIIEYENRLFTKKEAEGVALHTERFLNWATSMLPGIEK